MPEMNPEQFQSETGRGIDNLVSSSPLFYTTGYGSTVSPKYQELLGSPSILKPTFRDLTGCTRLTTSLSPTSNRPLPYLNKTKPMGKSSQPAQGTSRREKMLPPIRVNAKIRQIYSQVTSTTTNRSTQTETELSQSVQDAKLVVNRTDASTSPVNTPSAQPSLPPLSITPNYISKLEDLEKITGHIIIQRFFTRTDDVFGSWIEKQLALSEKNIPAASSDEESEEKIEPQLLQAESSDDLELLALENKDLLTPEKEENSELGVVIEDNIQSEEPLQMNNADEEKIIVEPNAVNHNPEGCTKSDCVHCECFKSEYEEDSIVPRSSTPIDKLDDVENDLISQCIVFELKRALEKDSQESGEVETINPIVVKTEILPTNDILESEIEQIASEVPDETQDSIVLEEDEEKSPDGQVDPVAAESCPQNDLESSEEKVETETTEAAPVVETAETIDPEADGKDVSVIEDENAKLTFDEESSESKILENAVDNDDDAAEKEIQGAENDTENLEDSVAEVTSKLDALEESIDQDSGQGDTSQKLTETEECQSKVADYLAELIEAAGAGYKIKDTAQVQPDQIFTTAKLTLNEIEPETGRIKRSTSIDSCLGTESSGENRNILNDSVSSRLGDSGRLENESTCWNSNPDVIAVKSIEEIIKVDSQDIKSWEVQESKEQEITVIRNKSGKSTSASASSEGRERETESDGDVGTETESEISSENYHARSEAESSLQELDGREADPEDDEDEEEGVSQDDQFETMISNHTKGKFIRGKRRNISTQTTKSLDSSRTTTASTNSSFDLEVISKSKRFTTTQLSSGNNSNCSIDRRRSYLPSSSSSLNLLNMKFSVGKEFESEVSICVPAKGGGKSFVASRVERTQQFQQQSNTKQRDIELSSLWKDVKSKMDSKVGGLGSMYRNQQGQAPNLEVRGNSLRVTEHLGNPGSTSNIENDVRIKKSLQRLKKMLDP